MFYIARRISVENKPLSKEFLVQRGKCCGNRCLNCPFDPRWKKNSTKIKAGFTLIEIIIVLTIITAVLAIATPNIFKQLERSKQKQFEHTVQKAVEDAKYFAMTRGEPVCIIVNDKQIQTLKIKHFVGQEFDMAFLIDATGRIYEKL